ncbi:GPI anchored cell wall protein, putative [Talaromyces stipitatus ATCC 10500]|uniref:GPI anchored cell wall protein, putative n=1 Tax=Talaromyces stipitatus (strain ATCC 10500 / CBS 375.48 / QM 6759 / NRRL 1006) TaxID=441959 RepID=B8MHT4_TALSN|nr:GPI anchored cell wall protein, putative [Talaromyces stipitatus ATCC 10500]EED16414.1 GPI anchored cell wall protein, putative [Talaromyces stipitatus ATCC 10500]
MLQFSTLTAAAVLMAATVRGQGTSGQSTISTTASSNSASSSTHIPVFGAGATTIPLSGVAGSIVGADSTATTIALNCANSTSCGIGTKPVTFTQGPSTLVADIVTQTDLEGHSGTLTVAVACNVVSSTQAATCTATATVAIGAQSQTSAITITTTTTIPSGQIHYDQLLITAGVDKLNSPAASHTSSGFAGAVAAPLPTGYMGIGVGGMAAAAVALTRPNLLQSHPRPSFYAQVLPHKFDKNGYANSGTFNEDFEIYFAWIMNGGQFPITVDELFHT